MQQQTLSRKEIVRNKPLTPLEKLLAEKIDIEEKCHMQEKKLNEDFAYIQDNVTGLILSSVSSLLFPPKKTIKKADQQLSHSGQYPSLISGDEENDTKSSSLSISDYITITKSLLPVAWEVLKPIIITWGIKKAKSILFGLFAGKKR